MTAEKPASPGQESAGGIDLVESGEMSVIHHWAQIGAFRRLAVPAALAATAWLGTVALIGPYVDSSVARALGAVMPPAVWSVGGLAALVAAAAMAATAGRRRIALLALMLAAWMAGHWLNGFLQSALPLRARVPFVEPGDAAVWALDRLTHLSTALLPLLVWMAFYRKSPWFYWGPGSWRRPTRLLSRSEKKQGWRLQLAETAAYVVLPLALLLQFTVGFAPVTEGKILVFLLPLLLPSLANALVEEMLFRGLIQPSLIEAVGPSAGIWLQGAFFGLFHFGLSPGLLAYLPSVVLIAIGSVVWGKSVLETRGLAWAVLCHALFDLAIFSAYFL